MSLSASAFESLQMKDVGRRFGGRDALVDLNLTIRAGEFIALLGPSGCGKSTALNCLAGLIPLTNGEILIDGKRIDLVPSEKRDFGMVFQNYALFPHLTVQKNIAFGLQMRNLPKAEIARRVAEGLDLVKLEEHAKKLPGQLSGGQQQRVAIARAIVLEPRLVLMDEPLSNLDAKLRMEMRAEIRRLHQSLGLTTVYVTHDQEEALSLADRLVVLREGRVQQIGTPEELHNNPVNWHVADFMGYRNLIDVEVESVDERLARVAGAGLSVDATLVQPAVTGDTVRLAIRPTDLVVASGPSTDGRNTFDALVNLVEYHGREFSVAVTTTSGQNLFVQAEVAPVIGEKVTLSVDPARALLYHSELDEMSSEQRELAEVRR
ncbi:MAG: ABC transporter ATP-binding protein [Propionibacteriaceae bacterium]|jgi:putative spermidine/putrescine transport system ATP-binding protein